MLYNSLIKGLIKCAAKEPNINFVGCNDIYKLNSIPDLEYSCFWVTPNTFTMEEDTITYSINLYYIDRWDESEENQLSIQSTGILALTNIINRFQAFTQAEVVYPITFTPFYQQFKDITAGVYARIDIIVDNDIGQCTNEF